MAALAAQVRSSSGVSERASAAQRLAKQLVRRGIEVRESVGLAERALSLAPDPEFALELAKWWVKAGDLIRGAALRQAAASGLPESQRFEELLSAARLHARAAQVAQANQALRHAIALDGDDARAWEMQGSLGFWSDLPSLDCSKSYLRASALRSNEGDDGGALENLLRAFEVAPSFGEAATALSDHLRAQGRPGAADEILREYLRRGSAAQRAAHHQRAFCSSLSMGNFPAALESALEAELDVELDPQRLEELLRDKTVPPSDFEGFLLELVRSEHLGGAGIFAEWLLAMVSAHILDWGRERVLALREMMAQEFVVTDDSLPPILEELGDEQRLRELRRSLASASDAHHIEEIREELALRVAALDRWTEALDVLSPLLKQDKPSLRVATFGVVAASRCRNPLGRARALHFLAGHLPRAAGAVTHAVASEMLLSAGKAEEARIAATAAVASAPQNERALASQAFVALGAPESASAGLLERSLSVLVARADACALLCRSADEAGSARLGLSWALRALELRPGDLQVRRSYLRQACRTGDHSKIAIALTTVLNQAAPSAPICEDVVAALDSLRGLSPPLLDETGLQVLAALGVRSPEVMDALTRLAKVSGASELLAAITERQLVTAAASERAGLSLVLSKQRLRAGQGEAAARALRRALAQGADVALVRESVKGFEEALTGDGKLAMLEIEVEILDDSSPGHETRRATAMRRVSAARFDMAQDTSGAVQLLLMAAEIDIDRGLELFAHYLHQLLGADAAVKQLIRASQKTEDPMRSGRLLGLAAREVFELGRRPEAFDLAVEALQRAPLLTELLSIAESCAAPAQVEVLLDLYTLLGDAAMGCYGERSVHYHAARELDKRGLSAKALDHACLAFEAVPSEGAAFILMARLAQGASGQDTLQATLQRVAEKADSDDERARWLSKAANLLDPEAVGRRQRVDILFRAAQMAPEDKSLSSLFEALAQFLSEDPEQKEEMWKRFQRLSTETLRHATGAHGAGLSVHLADAALNLFERPEFSLSCLNQAVESDIEIPEYQRLIPFAATLAHCKESAMEFVSKVRHVSDKREAPLGGSLARLAGKMAELLDQREQKSELLVRAASDFPEDSELVSLARHEANLEGRDDLLREIESLLPVAEQVASVLSRLDALSVQEGLDAISTLDLDAATEEKRALLLEAMGSRQEELGLFEDAAASYQELLELLPGSDEALRGLEREAERSGDHEELARILKLRAESVEDPDTVRRLTLRRAVVLEAKLGRAGEARESLSKLVEDKEDRSALRMLADSWERTGDHAEAAGLWVRVQALTQDPAEADDAFFRAASCFFESGAPRRAEELLQKIVHPTVLHKALILAVARAVDDKADVLKHLVALAHAMGGQDAEAGELYLEAARLSLSENDSPKARYCAGHAVRLLPESSEAKLLTLRLKEQQEPVSDTEQAATLLSELALVGDLPASADREVFAYLQARAFRLTEGADSASSHLEQSVKKLGNSPLLSLALADFCGDDHSRALALYEKAVGAELYGFFRDGDVLLRAGRRARKLGELGKARAFVSAVSETDPLREEAYEELSELAIEQERIERKVLKEAREAEKESIRRAAEEEAAKERKAAVELRRASDESRLATESAARKEASEEAVRKVEAEEKRRLQVLAEAQATRQAEVEAQVARQAEEEAARHTAAEAARQAEERTKEILIREAREEHREAARAVSEHQELVLAPGRTLTGKRASSKGEDSGQDHEELLKNLETVKLPTFAPEPEVETAFDLVPSERAPKVGEYQASDLTLDGESEPDSEQDPVPSSFLRRAPLPSRHPPKTERVDDVLVSALESGDVDAGLELLARLQKDRGRAREAMIVASHLVNIEPGDASILGHLVTTAARDGNGALALAVRHILGAYGAGDEKSAPPLEELIDQGEAARVLSMQGATSPLHEAVALVWEHSQTHYKRDISSYGVSGVERIPHSATTAFGGLCRGATRLLGMGRTPIFRVANEGDISLQVALLSPPAVIVSGDIPDDSVEFSYHFGAMLAAASPEHALIFGCPPIEMQRLFDALALSFGSGRAAPDLRPDEEVTKVASLFWESIPPRVQRRLSQLCKTPEELSFERVAASSRRVLRRAGLLVCGDLPTAVADACGETGIVAPQSLPELAECARRSPCVADVLSLALSPEYAEIRFRSSPG